MPNARQMLGSQGETAAVAYLEKQGFTILKTNYRTKQAELDIIAREQGTLCIIEVKTRTNRRKGLPKEAVTLSKQKKIIQGALFYLKENKLVHPKIRFDVIEVICDKERNHIHLIRNAFQAG